MADHAMVSYLDERCRVGQSSCFLNLYISWFTISPFKSIHYVALNGTTEKSWFLRHYRYVLTKPRGAKLRHLKAM